MSLSLLKPITQPTDEAQPDDAVARAANDVMLAIRALREAHMRLHSVAQTNSVKSWTLQQASFLYNNEGSLAYNLKGEGLLLSTEGR